MTIKYRAGMFALFISASACVSPATPPAGSAPAPTSPVSGAPPTAAGLETAPHAIFGPLRAWYVLPDGAFREDIRVTVTFPDSDPTAGRPRARLVSNGRVVDLVRDRDLPASWQAMLPLDGAPPGPQRAEIVVRLRDGTDRVLVQRDFVVSAPEYVVWTLDFEGDDAPDLHLANTAAIADRFRIPMTVMWNPRVWTTTQVSAARAGAMLAWTKERAARGDEVALHLHMWTDFVRAAGVAPRTSPSWAGRSDGYDVPMTAYDQGETRAMLDLSLRLMADHGLPRPVTFRAGGQFGGDAMLRALAAAGFIGDCSAVPAGMFGRLRYPWTLPADAQPYRPAANDANAAGDLPLLEAPTIGGNTFGHTATSIASIARANSGVLAPPGAAARERRAVTLVSHPSTVNATERAAIETLFNALEPLRYDRDSGPLRFVTLAELARSWR